MEAIFRIIGDGAGFKLERPRKSQEKVTILIPITAGVQVGAFQEPQRFEVKERVTRLGRHDAYVSPVGGEATLDADAFLKVLVG